MKSSSTEVMRDILAVGVIWGTSVFLQRVAVLAIDPLPMVTLRLLAAVAFFIPMIPRVVRGLAHQPRLLVDLGVVGLLNPAATGLLSALALRHASSGVVAVLLALGPVLTAVLAHMLLEERRLRWDQLTGLGVAFSGVVVLVATRSTGLSGVASGDSRGQWMALAIAALTAASAIYSRRTLIHADPVAAAAGQMAASLVVVGVLTVALGGWAQAGPVPIRAWLAVGLSGAIGLSASFILFFKMIARDGATTSTLALYVMPVVATLLGALFLKESITLAMTVGSALVLAGVFLFTRR